MPRQNRVLPTGEITAIPQRGLFMGNRGILHDDAGQLGTARWRHPHWICCLLDFRGRHRAVMSPRAYTELFFLDEAVALAAGHRPCAECRHADWLAFRASWEMANGPVTDASALDRRLHAARVTRRREQVRFRAPGANLPDGAFILAEDGAALVLSGTARPFTLAGYGPPQRLPAEATVLTPAPTLEALAAGYRPQLHDSARA